MAAIGQILRKATLSNRSTADYAPVNQDESDNEEEDDDVVFTQNGVKGSLKNGTNNNSTENDIEMGRLGIKKAKIVKSSEVEVRVMKMTILGKSRILCFVFTLLLMCLLLITGALYLGVYRVHGAHKIYDQTPEWVHDFPDFGSDCMIRLVDVDDDGRMDIIVAMLADWAAPLQKVHRETFIHACTDIKGVPYPCGGMIVALRGYDGKELYRLYTHQSVYEMNCDAVDLNKDGKPDCVATGRTTTLTAFDPKNGTVLWRGDTSALHELWNVDGALALPDFNGDGVGEVLVSHGGDPSFDPGDHERGTGRLIMLDGASGHLMGRYLEMPEPRETYAPPVMHTRKDGSQYVLFGDGGETVPGSFLAISLPDLYRYVLMRAAGSVVPNTRGAYTGWDDYVIDKQIGILEIYRGAAKGVLIAPTLVDINKDGVNDILMLSEEGELILYDGETLEERWHRSFACESYSSPAPGYFNDDDTLDFMFQMNDGVYPKYNRSQLIIVDGRNGRTLWMFEGDDLALMISELVVRTEQPFRDAFLYHSAGRLHKRPPELRKKRDVRSVQRRAPHGGEDDEYEPPYPPQPDPDDMTEQDWKDLLERLGNTYNNYKDQYGDGYGDGYGEDGVAGGTFGERDEENSERHEHELGTILQYYECTDDLDPATSELLLFDRTTMKAPLRVAELPAIRFNMTQKTFEDQGKEIRDKENPEEAGYIRRRRHMEHEGSNTDMLIGDEWADHGITWPICMVLENRKILTGSIGDVDGDGTLDLVVIGLFDGYLDISFETSKLSKMKTIIKIYKFNLSNSLPNATMAPLDAIVSHDMHLKGGEQPLREMKLRPAEQQPWGAYMGSRGDSVYHYV